MALYPMLYRVVFLICLGKELSGKEKSLAQHPKSKKIL